MKMPIFRNDKQNLCIFCDKENIEDFTCIKEEKKM